MSPSPASARAATPDLNARESCRRRRAAACRPAASHADRYAFEALAASLLERLAPEGELESVYARRVILAAWALREAVEAERVGVIAGIGDEVAGLLDDLRRQTARADRDLRRSLETLASIRGLGRPDWGRAAPLDTTIRDEEALAPDDDLATAEVEAFLPPSDGADDLDLAAIDAPAEDDPLPRWSDRLVFDANVSEDSPVVKGTWVTVAQVVSRIVDGFTWADILRSHPELTEDDIRACLAFAHEQESDEGRAAYLP